MTTSKSLREFLTAQDGRPVPPDDLVHMLVPLCEQVLELHGSGYVAELTPESITLNEVGELCLLESGKREPELNFNRLSDIQPSTGSALKVVGEYRVTMDGSFGGQVEDLLVFNDQNTQKPEKPMFLKGYESWEQRHGHHDSVTDIFQIGLIAASLSCGIDFDVPDEVKSFAHSRNNLFTLFGGLNPVIASLIQEMTALNRHDRAKDLSLIAQRLATYREQPVNVNVERVLAEQVGKKNRRIAVLTHLRDRLFDLSRRNRLIHFRSTRASVNCTEASVPLVMRIEAIKPNQLCTWGHQFEKDVLSGKTLQLSKWLRFEDHPYLKVSLNKILQQSRRDRNEFGFSNLRLVIAFLNWRNLKEAPGQPIKTPLLLLPITLKKKKGVRDQFTVECSDTHAEVNPALRYYFRQLYDIQLPQSINLEDTSIEAFHEDLASQINETEPNVRLQLQTKPVIELIHQRASLRVRQFQQRRSRAKSQAGFTRPDYSYAADDYRPLGVTLFEKFVRPSPLPQRSAVGIAEPRSDFMVAPAEGLTQSDTFALGTRETHKYEWSIDLTEITLANLNYKKMSLVQDYNSLIEEQTELPSFDKVFSVEPRNFDIQAPDPLEVEDHWEVVPADATQAKAIAFARNNHSLIIQGPPGTGKSQTITNLIADYVARGKRVLFVCEKRAALDVVYFRLKQVGLDRLSILVHDSQEDKKTFIHDLKEVYEAWGNQDHDLEYRTQNRNRTLAAYSEHMRRIVGFETAMHKVSDEEEHSIRSILNRRMESGPLSIKVKAKDRSRLPTLTDWDSHLSSIKMIERTMLSTFGLSAFADHSFSKLRSNLANSADFIECIESDLQEADGLMHELEQMLEAGQLPMKSSTSLSNALELLQQIERASNCGLLKSVELLETDSSKSRELEKAEKELIQAELVVKEKQLLAKNWRTELDPSDARDALDQAIRQESSMLRFFSGDWRKLSRAVKENYDFAAHASTPKVSDVLTRLVDLHSAREERQKTEVELSELFSSTDFKDLTILRSEWIKRLPKDKALKAILNHFEAAESNDEAFRNAERALWLVQSLAKHVSDLFADGGEIRLGDLFESVRSMQDDVDDLPDFLPVLQTLEQLPLNIRAVLREQSASLVEIEFLILREALARRLRKSQILKEIDIDTLEASVRRVRKAKQLLEDQNAEFILAKTHANFKANVRTSMLSAAQLNDTEKEFKKTYTAGRRVMENEFRKSMRYKSIRELADGESGFVVRDLKPIWLMSPLSVSDTLPLDPEQFDVVIFDEASQIPMEESVPALCRSNQVVVVGDEMQLPPTSFFSTSIDEDEMQIDVEENGEQIAFVLDADSLLSQSARNLPATLLSWHYRSRSESLISFSNAAFYDGRLTTIPDVEIHASSIDARIDTLTSPADNTLNKPITFHKVEHGVYNQRRNNAEALYIAELVRELLIGQTEESIGIVAFSEAQQEEIELALANLARESTEFGALLDEAYTREDDGQFIGLFVKNLENVQGDERDIIILSICYGPNSEGKMRMNFGPINLRGGEKRLNVIFSRSKHHMAVVSSISSEMITNVHNDGARALKTFLAFAESESVAAHDASMSTLATLNPDAKRIFGGSIPPHAIRSQMATALRERGYVVDEWVGSASLRCDLAIRNTADDAYVLGVFIDRDDTTSMDEQFERYVFQTGILEAFGWRITDVPSISWEKAPQNVLEKLETLIQSPAPDEQSFDPFDYDIAVPPPRRPQPTSEAVESPETISDMDDRREFHFASGASNKFWRIEQSRCDLTITYGRIGSTGRSMIKTFETPNRANLQAEKLISEKLKKGYIEV